MLLNKKIFLVALVIILSLFAPKRALGKPYILACQTQNTVRTLKGVQKVKKVVFDHNRNSKRSRGPL
jgi:hypothetical protein